MQAAQCSQNVLKPSMQGGGGGLGGGGGGLGDGGGGLGGGTGGGEGAGGLGGEGGLGGGEGGGGVGGGDGGLGDGEGGSGVGDGGAGEAGGGILQQASLQIAESDFFLLLEHSLLHFFWFPPLHILSFFFRSFFLHVVSSLSAAQSSGDGAVVRALPLFIPSAGSVFSTGVAEGWVSGGVFWLVILIHGAGSVPLILASVAFFI